MDPFLLDINPKYYVTNIRYRQTDGQSPLNHLITNGNQKQGGRNKFTNETNTANNKNKNYKIMTSKNTTKNLK